MRIVTMSQNEYTIHTMTRDEIDIAVSWAIREGWNVGMHDAVPFYATDPKGFLIGKIGGERVATISCVAYENNFGFVGFYIVNPKYRGMGYGKLIWNAAMKYLEDRNIALDGVVAQVENYKRYGFRMAYRDIRHEGIINGKYADGIVPLSVVPFAKILEYDRHCFPAPREAFLREWIKMPNSFAAGKMEGDTLKGYGVVRTCGVGYKIGPIFADDPKTAEDLLLAFAYYVDGGTLYLDTPGVNPAAVELAKRYNMKPVFECARMYTKEDPDIDLNKVFSVTTFELG